jgi:Heterokaryon incompatibility protein (HET)
MHLGDPELGHIYWVKLDPVMEWSTNPCPLCQLLIEAFPALSEDSSRSHTLFIKSSGNSWDRGLHTADLIVFTLDNPFGPSTYCGGSYLVLQPDDITLVRILEPLLDFSIVKSWLGFCQENHSGKCDIEFNSSTLPSSSSSLSSLSTFRLIDCETRHVIPFSGQKYVALSYLWGESKGEKGFFSPVLPNQVPRTIEDAIIVTLRLDLRYLWVDRYCINQGNPQEIAEQVPKMDLVYNSSQLTIIAAAGQNPDFGLPGVSNGRPPIQAHGRIGRHFLVSTLPDPVHIIKRSKWNQRGWTYQEGLLSRRRLVFTEEQVYFECPGMFCNEVLNVRLENLHTLNKRRFRARYTRGIDTGLFPKQIGSEPLEVFRRIEEYSTRSLTNQSDILMGILGIFRSFEMSSQGVRQCIGVPIHTISRKLLTARDLDPKGRESLNAIAHIPTRSRLTGFCAGLCWNTKEPLEKRVGFPSWSWTGWIGEIEWNVGGRFYQIIQGDTDIQVQLEVLSGHRIDWDEFDRLYNEMNDQLAHTLHISAWVSKVDIIKPIRYHDKLNWITIVYVVDKGPSRWLFKPTSSRPLSGSSCFGIHLGYRCFGNGALVEHFMMIIQEVESEIYERVGLGFLHSSRVLPRISDLPALDSFPDDAPNPNTFSLPAPNLVKEWMEFKLQ